MCFYEYIPTCVCADPDRVKAVVDQNTHERPLTIVDVMSISPQTLSVEDQRRVASWAADCVEHVPVSYETAVPTDSRGAPTGRDDE